MPNNDEIIRLSDLATEVFFDELQKFRVPDTEAVKISSLASGKAIHQKSIELFNKEK